MLLAGTLFVSDGLVHTWFAWKDGKELCSRKETSVCYSVGFYGAGTYPDRSYRGHFNDARSRRDPAAGTCIYFLK